MRRQRLTDRCHAHRHTRALHHPRHATTAAALLATCAWLLMAQSTAAARPDSEDLSAAVAACESAARQSLSTQHAVADLKFAAAPTEPPGLAGADQRVLQGSGSWRDGAVQRRFDYSCNVDLRTPAAVGLVLRDTTPASALPKPAQASIEPDLSRVSPAACESSAALALKKRWPQVSEIRFDPQTRRLSQSSARKAELDGQGLALPMPGAPFTHFTFQCELDPRDGRVLQTSVSG